MSAQTAAGSTAEFFSAIFDVALDDFETRTGQNLTSHPFTISLGDKDSPDAILEIFRKQVQAFDNLDEDIRLDNLYWVAVVKDVSASYKQLVEPFGPIQFFLQRLDYYTEIPLPQETIELLGKIMAQVLSVLALSIKTMNEGRISVTNLKRLLRRTNLEDGLKRLDLLTKEKSLITAARNVTGMKAVIRDAHDENQRRQWREKLGLWLLPPDPSVNHNVACRTRHNGTADWFLRGSTFDDWKKNSSVLWIGGSSGSGKSALCSAIIEDMTRMREDGSALVAFYYFDFRDAAKRDIRGLLTSLLKQLADESESCRGVLHQLYKIYHDGTERPSDAALTQYLKNMLQLPGQVPVFIIIDGLDECPNDFGTPSARESVLNFLKDLVGLKHSSLHVCITSRPEQDISFTLSHLTIASHTVSLQDEKGQTEDINSYVRTFIYTNETMRRWRVEDRSS
ncbi:hypothetical protein BC826DRAFT_1109030 [Russula brevipes]|nr:hypothetical protein BC826DRAFT_1109030 [Russula brevipes]